MSSINSNFQAINPNDHIHLEMRQVVGGNQLDKPTFGQKLKSVFAKVGSIFGGIAGALGNFFGPFGMIGSAVGYGIKNFSDKALQNMQARKEQEAMIDHQAAALSSQGMAGFYTPGFNPPSGGSPSSAPAPSLEWSPYAQNYAKEITNTLSNKGSATLNAVNQSPLNSTM